MGYLQCHANAQPLSSKFACCSLWVPQSQSILAQSLQAKHSPPFAANYYPCLDFPDAFSGYPTIANELWIEQDYSVIASWSRNPFQIF